MSLILPRPLTVADLERIEQVLPENLWGLARQTAAQFKARRHKKPVKKKPARRKRHAPTR